MIHSYSKHNPAGVGCNAPASIPTHHRTMKAILTLHIFGEKVKVVSVRDPLGIGDNGFEYWVEEQPLYSGGIKRVFGIVGNTTRNYDVEITDDTPTESIKQ